ncbi:MAG: DNA polymerase II [Desulfurococcales archaeon]|nr:DNA polymerase II [Desulfurococcales archaeon]
MWIEFQVLDASYEVLGGEAVIALWARLNDNRRAILYYRGFKPYFYALVEDDADIEDIARKIKSLSKPSSPITEVRLVEKRYLGKRVNALRIETTIPSTVREYREKVARIPGVREVLEADIRFTMRYLIDKNIYPLRWYGASVEEKQASSGTRVDGVYMIRGELEELEGYAGKDPLEDLRLLAFDIEAYNPQRTPDPRKDPVIIIGYMTDEMSEPELLVAEDNNDRLIIKKFVEKILEYDPDIIVGYNQNRFDWPYLVERSKVLGLKLDVGRKANSPPQPSVYGHYSIAGRLNVDLYDFADEMYEVKMKTLEEVADYLGVMPKDKRVMLEWWQISEYWDDPEKRPTLLQYAKDDVYSTYGLVPKFLPFGAQLSQVSGLPLDQVMAASVGFRLEWRLMREAFKFNELVPNRVERLEESYTGAIVLKPKPGIHENIAVLDFASMYPSIMVKYNVGPDTLVKPGEPYKESEVNIAPEVGHKFRKNPPGFFKLVVQKFLDIRRRIKSELKKYPEGSPMYNLLNERQKAVKLLANASYGYMGWPHARWYCKACAESITAWGRSIIKRAISKAKELGLDVIYGDTDSLFVTYDKVKVESLIRWIEEKLGFEVKIDKIYKRVYFTEAKKRYVGLTDKGKIDVVGFEAMRGDWSELAKEAQMKVAEIVLSTGDVEKAVSYVRGVIEELRKGKIDMRKLIIWKTLSKRLEEYTAEQPHVVVARQLKKLGIKVHPGMKIGYVVVKGTGPLSKRVKPYFLAKPAELDIDYYIDKQLIPAVMRILKYFGVTEKRLKGGGRQTSLLEFMGG